MSLSNSILISLPYGRSGHFTCEVDAERIHAAQMAPRPMVDFQARLDYMLEHPLDYPAFKKAVIPGDHVIIVLDRGTPQAASLIQQVWKILSLSGVHTEDVTILQPADWMMDELSDPRKLLDAESQQAVRWQIHDATDTEACSYLTNSSQGDRIYLARELLDADVVISIGHIGFDPLIGFRGTNSVFYPGLSQVEAFEKSLGQGHRELLPEDVRPFRQVIDEIAWLLGTQFTLQVIPSAQGGVADVLAGTYEAVLRRGKALLNQYWRLRQTTRVEIIVVAVDSDAAGHNWTHIGAALESAANLVVPGGKIILLTELNEELGPGLDILRECEHPKDAIKPLRDFYPFDTVCATQIAQAVDWADVYLLSQLQGDLVEDLFMVPLDSEREVSRLIGNGTGCLFIESAQHIFGQVVT